MAAREQILHSTIELIGSEGIGAVSNRRVASAAGVALGSLTYHFPDQSKLLHEALVLYAEEEVQRFGEVATRLRAQQAGTDDVLAEVQRAILASAERTTEGVAELELHLHASRNPELRDASQRCFAAYDDFATAALEALNVPEPARYARAVVALLTGMAVRRHGTGEQDIETAATALQAMLRGAVPG